MDAGYKKFSDAIQAVTQSVKKINNLLVSDRQLFKADDLTAINDSNEHKTDILNSLNEKLVTLQATLHTTPEGKKQTISAFINAYDGQDKSDLQQMMNTLHQTLSEGYQLLVANNTVVSANLEFMHDIWEKLSTITQQNSGLYQKPEIK